MFRKLIKHMAFYAAVTTVIALCFQNCSRPGQNKSQSSTVSQQNGSGYDGKTYVHIGDNPCADGNPVDSAIQVKASTAYLIRDKCADIATNQQNAVDVVYPPYNHSMLLYQGRAYVESVLHTSDTFMSGRWLKAVRASSGLQYLSYGSEYGVELSGTLDSGTTFLAKFDSDSNLLWSKKSAWLQYDMPWLAKTVAPLAGGGFLGFYKYNPAISGTVLPDSDPHIVVLDPQGAPILSKRMIPAGTNGPDVGATAMVGDSNGNLFALTKLATTATDTLTKLAPDGTKLWSKQAQGSWPDLNMTMEINDTLIVYGTADFKNVAARLSPDTGAILWTSSFSPTASVRYVCGDDKNLLFETVEYNWIVDSQGTPVEFAAYTQFVLDAQTGVMKAHAQLGGTTPSSSGTKIYSATMSQGQIFISVGSTVYVLDANLNVLGGKTYDFPGFLFFSSLAESVNGLLAAGWLTPANTQYPTDLWLHLPAFAAGPLWNESLPQIPLDLSSGAGLSLADVASPFGLEDRPAPVFEDYATKLSIK